MCQKAGGRAKTKAAGGTHTRKQSDKYGRHRDAKGGNGWRRVTTGEGVTGSNGRRREATGGNGRQQEATGGSEGNRDATGATGGKWRQRKTTGGNVRQRESTRSSGGQREATGDNGSQRGATGRHGGPQKTTAGTQKQNHMGDNEKQNELTK